MDKPSRGSGAYELSIKIMLVLLPDGSLAPLGSQVDYDRN